MGLSLRVRGGRSLLRVRHVSLGNYCLDLMWLVVDLPCSTPLTGLGGRYWLGCASKAAQRRTSASRSRRTVTEVLGHLQITVPHKRDRCIDMKKAVIEPLVLFATPGQDEDGTFPVVTAKNFLGKQLADFSSSRFNRSDVGGDPITLREQGLVHRGALGCIRGNSMSYLANSVTEQTPTQAPIQQVRSVGGAVVL